MILLQHKHKIPIWSLKLALPINRQSVFVRKGCQPQQRLSLPQRRGLQLKASAVGRPQESDGLNEVERQKRKQKLWYLAIKPPMYSVCIIPVLVSFIYNINLPEDKSAIYILVGAATAYCDTGVQVLSRTGSLLLGSICIIAWLNLSNDAFDAAMGVDGDKAESVVNLTNNRQGVLWTANLFLVAGAATLWRAISTLNDTRIGVMLTLAIMLGYMYQGPPFRLSFKGLGEPITFVTFGPLATCSFYLAHVARGVQGGQAFVSPTAAVASVIVGFTTATILFCSHFHQMEGDKAAGKQSPIVRLGSTKRGLKVLQWIVALTYLAYVAALVMGNLPWTCALSLPLSIPQARSMLLFCSENYQVPARVRPLKLYAVKWHTSVGLAICIGMLLQRRFVMT